VTDDSVDLSNADWNDMVPRLTYFAAVKIRQLTWLGERHGTPCKGMEPGDFVNEAVKKTLAGTRNWNRDVTLYNHLAGVISSDISNLANCSENTTARRYSSLTEDIHDSFESGDPATLFRNKQEFENVLAFVELHGPNLKDLFLLIVMWGRRSPEELSLQLNKSVEEINNLKKQLRRVLDRYLREPETG